MLESSSNQHDRGKSRFGDEVAGRRHEYEWAFQVIFQSVK